jgi:acid phosphatase
MMRKQPLFLMAAFTVAVLFPSCATKNHLPKPDHIVIVVEENHGYDQIIGSENAPYINRLANEGALFTHAQAVTHPSQPNYLALFSGSLQGITSDKCLKNTTPFTTPNLGAALLKAGYSFTGYAETLPTAGFLECYYHQTPGYDYVLPGWIGRVTRKMIYPFPPTSRSTRKNRKPLSARGI